MPHTVWSPNYSHPLLLLSVRGADLFLKPPEKQSLLSFLYQRHLKVLISIAYRSRYEAASRIIEPLSSLQLEKVGLRKATLRRQECN